MASDSESSVVSATALPSKHSSIHPGSNALITAGIIIADVVGAGILSMANAMAQFGWFLGTLLLVLLLAMNIHISMLMWRAKMQHPEATTYMGLVEAVFKSAPRYQHRFIVAVTGTSQYGFLFGILALYVLSFAKGLGMLFYNTHLCLPYWALIGCGMILPFCVSARAMGTWKSLVWANVITILGSITIPLLDMAVHGVEETRPAGSHFDAVARDLDFHGIMSGLSTYTFAFTSQFMLVEIMTEMQDPKELPKAYVGISAPFQLVAFLIVGVGGYYYKGDAVHGMIADNLPFGFPYRAAALCLLVHMLIVYQIKGIVICRALHRVLHPASSEEETPQAWAVWSALVCGLAASAYVVSQLIPFFSDFVDLLGAMLAPICCLIVPILTYLRSLWPTGADSSREVRREPDVQEDESDSDTCSSSDSSLAGTKGPQNPVVRSLEGLLMIIELLLASILVISGTISATKHIIMNWSEYGYPFECHCEGIWRTCECSAHHAGMETCLIQPTELTG